jgi:hypothetical protein
MHTYIHACKHTYRNEAQASFSGKRKFKKDEYIHTYMHTCRNEAQASFSGKRKFKKDEYIFVVFDGGTSSIAVVKLKKDAMVRTYACTQTRTYMYACIPARIYMYACVYLMVEHRQ